LSKIAPVCPFSTASGFSIVNVLFVAILFFKILAKLHLFYQ
jgi:hypothetical protein